MAQRVAGLLVKLSADSAELKSDLRAIKSQLRGFGRSANREANRVKYAFNKIRRAAQVVASAFIFVAGIRQLGNLVSAMAKAEDSVLLLEARFKQFSRAGDSFTRVYNLSKTLGVGLEETANGMTRLLVATKAMGTAQSVLEDVHKNIVILGRAGGTSTEEMKGAMRQLSQGLASGRLQGEELRSVLENLPLVAMEIAKQMGIGLGQIRKVAAEGKITGQVVVDALSEIGIKMEDLPTTWAMQTENLRTEWSLFLADLSKAVDEAGLLEDLVEAVKWVRFNMLGSFTGQSTEELKTRQKELESQLRPGFEKDLSTGRSFSGMRQQSEMMKAMGVDFTGPIADLADTGRAVIEAMASLSTGATFGATQESLREELRAINEELEGRGISDALAEKLAGVKDALVGDDGAKAAIDKLLRTYETAEEKVARLREELLPLREVDVERYNKIYAALGETLKEGINEISIKDLPKLKRATKETTEKMSEYAKRAAQNMQDAFSEVLFDPFENGVKGMLKSFLDAIRRMIAETAAASFFESGAGSAITGFLGSIFGRASGGPVAAGGTYLVGERGPELLTMGAKSGSIIPNGAMGGVVVNQNYHIEAGADWGTLQRVLPPMFDRNREATVAEISNRINDGRL